MEVQEVLPAVTPLVYLAADRLKIHIPKNQHQWIPEVCAVIGLALVLLGCYLTQVESLEDWFRLSIQGVLLGYAATGIHQSKKGREVTS